MVSRRCITVVTEAFEKLGLPGAEVHLGEVNLKERLSDFQLGRIREVLLESGFELLDDKKSILVEQIKTQILQLVYYCEEPLVENLSVYLSFQLHHGYTYMSNLFSDQTGTTIEKYYICHKIERVKELLSYGELSLTDIAYKMHYSSVAHLSAQFKKVTGLTPTQFKQAKGNKRDFIETICQ
jgi:YesN/AraC family two-component response regulator